MPRKTIGEYEISQIYPLYIAKLEKKGRSKDELDAVTKWLTGYDDDGLTRQIERDATMKDFFDEAPHINPKAREFKGVLCGVRIEDISDPLKKKVKWLDKLVDELARGRPLEKILNR